MYIPKHFKYSEFDSGLIDGGKEEGSGQKYMTGATVRGADKLRSLCGFPLKVNSAYRSPEYNRHIGGVDKSYHVRGMAIDFSVKDDAKLAIILSWARLCGFNGIGVYRSKKTGKPVFVHLDTRAQESMWFKQI